MPGSPSFRTPFPFRSLIFRPETVKHSKFPKTTSCFSPLVNATFTVTVGETVCATPSMYTAVCVQPASTSSETRYAPAKPGRYWYGVYPFEEIPFGSSTLTGQPPPSTNVVTPTSGSPASHTPSPSVSTNFRTVTRGFSKWPMPRRTLKLSVFENAGTNPWKHPVPHGLSTAFESPTNCPIGVAHALYTPPLFGVLSYGISW